MYIKGAVSLWGRGNLGQLPRGKDKSYLLAELKEILAWFMFSRNGKTATSMVGKKPPSLHANVVKSKIKSFSFAISVS